MKATTLASIKAETALIVEDTGTTLDTKLDNIQGATFSSATDSLEALRNRGDSAWTGSATTSDSGTAQAGAANSITLAATADAVNDNIYNGQVVFISAGTGVGQSRAIDGYTASSRVADVITAWVVNPSSDSVYEVTPNDITEVTAAPTAAANADAVWNENTAGHTSAGTFGEQCKNDIDAILVDTAVIGALGAGLTALSTQASVDTIGTNVDAILVDTDVIDDATSGLVKIASDVAAVLVDTAVIGAAGAGLTALSTQASVDAVKAETALIVEDTGTTLNTKVNTIDTATAAIQVVTDKFAFTVANQVDANVESINATTVLGVGTSINKWRA
jgi:hypothetical protein